MSELTEDQRKMMQDVLYFMNKAAARDSFRDFLEFCNTPRDDWDVIKKHIEQTLGVELYC